MIALLCPTRGRPAQCKRMIESARATSKTPPDIYVGVQGDAAGYIGYGGLTIAMPDWPTTMSWNVLAVKAGEHQKNKLFMLAADDMVFTTPGWDRALLDHYAPLTQKAHVYALQDSRDEHGAPHPIVTREYIEAMGYFMPPIFLHWFVDTWTVEIAKANGCFTHMRDYMLMHDKPSDRGAPDETFSRIRRMGWHERDKYVNKTCQHFLESEKRRLGEAMI